MKLAHMWHGPFRMIEKCGEHAVRLEVQGTPYRLFPLVHISKFNWYEVFLTDLLHGWRWKKNERVDFDEALLPDNSWKGNLAEEEYEVGSIMDVRSGRKTRYGRIHRQFLVQ